MYENLVLGSSGDNVVILQEKLKRLGFYNPVINGEFGLATEEGVKAFQRSVGLSDTGVVDGDTWVRLNSETEPKISTISVFPNLGYGSTGSYVRDLQTKLKALLFYTGEINGDFDRETEVAVKRFQLNNEITANGVVDSNTWNLINSLYGNLNSCVLNDVGVDDNNTNNDGDTGNNLTYTVKSGDTLYAIARRYDTSVDAIKSLNNLTSDILQIGQVLKIPTTSTDNTTWR